MAYHGVDGLLDLRARSHYHPRQSDRLFHRAARRSRVRNLVGSHRHMDTRRSLPCYLHLYITGAPRILWITSPAIDIPRLGLHQTSSSHTAKPAFSAAMPLSRAGLQHCYPRKVWGVDHRATSEAFLCSIMLHVVASIGLSSSCFRCCNCTTSIDLKAMRYLPAAV